MLQIYFSESWMRILKGWVPGHYYKETSNIHFEVL